MRLQLLSNIESAAPTGEYREAVRAVIRRLWLSLQVIERRVGRYIP